MEGFNESQNPDSLDNKWFDRFSEVYFEDYEKLTGNKETREIEKTAFLTGVERNPRLDYPKLAELPFDDFESKLLELKEELLSEETNVTVRSIYRAKINEHLATVRMLKAANEGDDRVFSRYSTFVHGSPQPESTAYVLDAIRTELNLDSDNAQWSDERLFARKRLLDLVDGYEFGLPSGFVSRDALPQGLEIKGQVASSQEVVEEIESTLQELGITDWKVLVDENSGTSNFSVSQEYKQVLVPTENQLIARKLSKKKLAGLIAHEIKTHVARREAGQRTSLKLLGFGLDRYVKGEEGIATFAEQQVTGANEFAGIQGYFAMAVAAGFDGTPRDFRDTFEILKDYFVAKGNSSEKADDLAWGRCVRTFRGTTGATPGAIFTKDLAYLGNRSIWELVNNNEEMVASFSIGKYDPTNERHVAWLVELGILDSDLDRLSLSI